jgi:hypothetical protein
MQGKIRISFENRLIVISLDDIVSVRTNTARVKRGHKYQQIMASIQTIGIIEPPVVIYNDKLKKYIVLDGNLRIEALREIGIPKVSCLISSDDENYTYNKYINKLSPVQSYNMINLAIEKGVSEDKIAKALDIDMVSLKQKKTMLKGISQDVIELIKDKIFSEKVFRLLRKMKPNRQLIAVQMMIDSGKYTYDALKIIYDASCDDDLVVPKNSKRVSTEILERKIRLENETLALNDTLQSLRFEYGINMIKFSSLHSYLRSLLNNTNIANFIKNYDEGIFNHFSKIIAIDSVTLSKME